MLLPSLVEKSAAQGAIMTMGRCICMNYKELKYYIEQLEALDTENITVAKKLLLDIAKEALIYRKQNAINARRKFSQQKVKTM